MAQYHDYNPTGNSRGNSSGNAGKEDLDVINSTDVNERKDGSIRSNDRLNISRQTNTTGITKNRLLKIAEFVIRKSEEGNSIHRQILKEALA